MINIELVTEHKEELIIKCYNMDTGNDIFFAHNDHLPSFLSSDLIVGSIRFKDDGLLLVTMS